LDQLDDKALAERAQKGDQAAFLTIYQRHYEPVFRYIYFRTGDQMAAEELASDVFVRLVEKIDQFSFQGRPILAWLYTISRNLVIDHRRKNHRQRVYPLNDQDAIPVEHQPAHAAERRLEEEALFSAIEMLTEPQRQVILMKFIEQRSNEEVSEILNKPIGAVKSLQHRALATLRRIMEKESFVNVRF